jgi:transposase
MNTSEINSAYSSTSVTYKSTYKNDKTKTDNKTDAKSEVKAENTSAKTETSASTTTQTAEGVVYESTNIKNMSEKERASLVEKLKADADARTAQLRSLVEKMFLQQGQKITDSDSMWKFLASGDFTVDKETAEAAKEAISEDGYWGVKQTSQRIFDMAVALSGGDSEKMDDMLEAFQKGFKQATKTWGKELPDISQKTYAAVMEKFENYKKENSAADTTTENV